MTRDEFGIIEQAALRAERDWLGEREGEGDAITRDALIANVTARLHSVADDLARRLTKLSDDETRQLIADKSPRCASGSTRATITRWRGHDLGDSDLLFGPRRAPGLVLVTR